MTAPDMPVVLNGLAKADQQDQTPADEFVTSTGIRFKLRAVAPLLALDAQAHIKRPIPPKVHITDKDTYEENLDDPDYRRAVEVFNRTISELANAVYLTRGTQVLSVPEGTDKYEDEQWAADITDLTQLEIPAEKNNRRYFCWLKYVALVSMNDFTGLVAKIMAISGVTREPEVAAEADRFRDNTQGDAVIGVSPPEAN